MSRIRTIKPDFYKHDKLFEIEKESQLPIRIAFAGLFSTCDREGRFVWNPRRLKIDILPYDDIDMSKVLECLLAGGFLIKYFKKDKAYGCIPTWHKHQAIPHREAKSSLPSPDDCDEIIRFDDISSGQIASNTVTALQEHGNSSAVALQQHGHARGEGKGREGKGKERKNPSVDEVDLEVDLIFEHWKKTMGHLNAKLDSKRKALIKSALKTGYDYTQLCNAITGCSYTPHNIGQNDRGQRFDGLNVILRNADQIDRFISNCKHPPAQITHASKIINTMDEWAQEQPENLEIKRYEH